MYKKVLLINSNAMFEDEKKELFIYGGTAKLLVDLSESYSVTNFHFKEPKNSSDTINNFNLSNTKVSCKYVDKKGSKLIAYFKAYLLALYLLIKSDCLYLFYPNSFKFLILFCILINKPYGIYVRGQKNISSRFSKFLYKHSAFINTVSPYFTNIIRPYNNNVSTIKPMINYSINDFEINKKYKDLGYFNLLFVGRLEEDKGVFELLEAFHSIYLKYSFDIKLIFVGDGTSLYDLKKYVQEFNLGDCVSFTGSIFDPILLKQIYLKSDILILPTYHEGFPRVLYEAMIFNVPIITTFVGGIPSLMKNKVNCLEIAVKSKEDITLKIWDLINDFNYAKTLSIRANSDVKNYLLNHNKSHLQLLLGSLEDI
ncbi:glycosyltransferase family 4 protein [Algoriphagus aestuarii]|nr:glycosyltransferase family 4 protein [Algoriphagus aestuarii]